MKNSPTETNPLKKANVIYECNCATGDCELQNSKYVGMATTTLSRRLTMHLQNGAPKKHMKESHNQDNARTACQQYEDN